MPNKANPLKPSLLNIEVWELMDYSNHPLLQTLMDIRGPQTMFACILV